MSITQTIQLSVLETGLVYREMNNLYWTKMAQYLPKITGRRIRQIREAMLTRNEQPIAFNQSPKIKINKKISFKSETIKLWIQASSKKQRL